jgi:hypothetical protein
MPRLKKKLYKVNGLRKNSYYTYFLVSVDLSHEYE